MISRAKDQGHRTKTDVWDGKGTLHFQDILTAEQAGDRLGMCAVVTLNPGDFIGEHPHTDNAELYYMLEGVGTVMEDGAEYPLYPGDGEFCADGHTHGMRNDTDAPIRYLAAILYNR